MHRVQQYHWGFPFCPTCSYGFYTRNGGAQTRLFGAKTADKDSQGGPQVSREPCEVVDLGAEAACRSGLDVNESQPRLHSAMEDSASYP